MKNNRSPLWIFLGLDLLLVFVVIWATYLLLNQALKNDLIARETHELQARQEQFFGSRQDMGRLEQARAVLSKVAVYDDRQVILIDNLEQIAKRAGISYELNNAIQGDMMTMDMSVGGTYSAVFSFLKQVENFGYWVRFEQLSLSRGALAKAGENWTGNVTISIPAVKKVP